MSKSINLLLKNLNDNSSNVNKKPSNLKLINAEMPNYKKGMNNTSRNFSGDNSLDDTLNVKDMFHKTFKLPDNTPRNGRGFSLPRGRHLGNKYREAFLLNNAIDPNNIRARTDPDHAMPTYSYSTLHSLMPASVQPPHNNVELVQRANTNYLNYKNRFAPKKS